MQQFGTSASTFNTAVRWHKLDEVENERTSHKFILFAIFMPKNCTVVGSLTKMHSFWVTMYLQQTRNDVLSLRRHQFLPGYQLSLSLKCESRNSHACQWRWMSDVTQMDAEHARRKLRGCAWLSEAMLLQLAVPLDQRVIELINHLVGNTSIIILQPAAGRFDHPVAHFSSSLLQSF